MADMLVASAAGGAARLFFEVSDTTGLCAAIRADCEVPAVLSVTIPSGDVYAIQLDVGTRRFVLPAQRRFDPNINTGNGVALSLSAIH